MGLKSQYLDQRFTTALSQHPALPFFHCCDGAYFQHILDAGALIPRSCPVYNEKLLYLFYGRPAYKSAEVKNSAYNFMMPVCFIINYEAITSIRRALAFDSGAFEMYSDYLHRSMAREEFEITPDKASFNKIVDYFYEDNSGYFDGRARNQLDPYDPIHYQIESFYSIITSKHRQEIDDRKGTIEVQLDYPLHLNQSTVEAIILPTHLIHSQYVKSMIEPLGIQMIEVVNYGIASRNYSVYILDQVRSYLTKRKLLHGN